MSSTSSTEVQAARVGAVSTKAAATIGAVAVLLSTLFSVIAALVSANIAADSTIENTSIQLAGETDRSRAEFLRSQRQVLYSQVLEHLQDISNTQQKFADGIYQMDPAEAREQALAARRELIFSDSREGLAGVVAARTQLVQDNYSMSIIGSPGAHQALTDLIQLHWEQKDILEDLAIARHTPPHSIPRERANDYYRDGKDAVAKAEERFIAAAREDMGAD